MTFGEAVKEYWPLFSVAAGGLLAFGTLKSDVSHLKGQQDTFSNDRERIVRIETRQQAVKETVDEIKKDVKLISRQLQEAHR